jgi:hypothetical protein
MNARLVVGADNGSTTRHDGRRPLGRGQIGVVAAEARRLAHQLRRPVAKPAGVVARFPRADQTPTAHATVGERHGPDEPSLEAAMGGTVLRAGRQLGFASPVTFASIGTGVTTEFTVAASARHQGRHAQDGE